MWIQFRPPTNADHADILRAREFLEERKRSLIEQYQLQSSDTTISVNLYSDPLARTVLDDANTALQNASLEYWPENMHQSREGNVMVPSPVVVPSALYTASSISAGAEISKTSRYVPLGHFEEMSTCDAVISTGSLISISETGYDYPHSCQVSRQWYYVHRVDLLFARVLVSRCLAPPLPWILSPDDQPTEIKHWIEISKLWHILVCSCRTEQKSQRFQ